MTSKIKNEQLEDYIGDRVLFKADDGQSPEYCEEAAYDSILSKLSGNALWSGA